ncbi:hypothetical protein P280DRAFT_524821 [Massarina eburnea CBS 473.64]|uniref:Uncharacterized protein n=1 Tax=Massarina eburnea CBS 473.64 TaxID=1395130 RepID=A0A6A6SGR4_9PLEO|nr:hypothetical protein P280DRAFT_524821 [Massarina eburnea CBS 473.64]
MAPGTNLSVLAHEVETTPPSTLPHNKGATVLNPALITQEFDGLRFEAAAARQLDPSSHLPPSAPKTQLGGPPRESSFLISSPYNNPGHYLDLSTLDTPNLIFAKALTALQPVVTDYATAPYIECLNFRSTVLQLVRDLAAVEGYEWKTHTFYVVVFRSKLKEDIDNDLLYKLDYESHREACESGGLLKYWFGSPDGERKNLATCFWRSREDAYKGGLGPWHAKARAAGRTMYEHIRFSTHQFTVLDGAEEVSFEEWVD